MKEKKVEQIVEDTIKYSTDEVKKVKRKYIKGTILTVFLLISVSLFIAVIFKYERPLKYNESLLEVVIPEDEGIDVNIKLSNYAATKAILVKTDEESYDLYINVTTTFANKMFKDNDKGNNLLRVGNGMIVDYQSETLRGYLPNGLDNSAIKKIYYIDNLSKKTSTLSDKNLKNYKSKVLIWERN